LCQKSRKSRALTYRIPKGLLRPVEEKLHPYCIVLCCIVEEIKTYFVLSIFYENRDVYEMKWKNVVEPERPQII
jgi:hypothetical protein